MLSRALRQATAHSPPFSKPLPPTFLLPLRAHLTTISTTTDPNPPPTSYTHTTPTAATLTSHLPPPNPQLKPRRPPQLSRHTPHPTAPHPNLTLLPLLAAQPPHYITAHIHARPYLLTAGSTLRLPFHMPSAPPGTILRLNRASMLGSRDFTFRGAPWVDEGVYLCRAVVVGVEGEPVRVVEKTKRRDRRVRRKVAKGRFTVLRIMEVKVWGTGGEGGGGGGEEEGS